MFIQTEATPNPATLKFIPGRVVVDGGPMEFSSRESATRSPLAEKLFDVPGITGVFYGSDFITVTKAADDIDWRELKAPILAAVMEHFTSGAALLREGDAAVSHDDDVYEGETAQVVAEIKDLLDTRIRPAVARDGGDILFNRFDAESGVVYLHMRGALM